MGSKTTIEVGESVRDDLREYKAKHGLTYDQAIDTLLSEVRASERITCPGCGEFIGEVHIDAHPAREMSFKHESCGKEIEGTVWFTDGDVRDLQVKGDD